MTDTPMLTQSELVLKLHDEGRDTTEVSRLARLPWMITTGILKANNRTVRPKAVEGKHRGSR